MTSCFIFATLAVVLQQNGFVFGQVPSSMTAAELWNPSTWFYPYAIAISEGYRDYYVKAQKATNELYKQIYATNAFPWITGNWGGAPTPPAGGSGGSGQSGQGGQGGGSQPGQGGSSAPSTQPGQDGGSAPSTQPGQGGGSAPSTQPEQNPPPSGTGGSTESGKQEPSTPDAPEQKPGDGVNAEVQDQNTGTGVGGGVDSEGPNADVNADTEDKEPTDE